MLTDTATPASPPSPRHFNQPVQVGSSWQFNGSVRPDRSRRSGGFKAPTARSAAVEGVGAAHMRAQCRDRRIRRSAKAAPDAASRGMADGVGDQPPTTSRRRSDGLPVQAAASGLADRVNSMPGRRAQVTRVQRGGRRKQRRQTAGRERLVSRRRRCSGLCSAWRLLLFIAVSSARWCRIFFGSSPSPEAGSSPQFGGTG